MNSEKKQNTHSETLKKNVAGLISVLIVISLTACSNKPKASEGAAQIMLAEQETTEDQQKIFVNQQESSLQAVENTDSEETAEELLDRFINGSIGAIDPTDLTSAFYISDLNMDSGEWDSFSVGEKVDLDNDGENELILNGPYGGIYLDARDNRVYKFTGGDGTALTISYTYYNGAIWIMYSNRSSAGFEFYHMEKFEGADNLTAEMNFGEEFDPNHAEAGIKYTWNGNEISCDEYTALCSKIFAAEVSTTLSSSADKVQEMENKENSDEVETGLYEGEYCDYDVNEPSLEIKKKDDGTYQIQIDLFRMWYFHDGVGRMTEDGLEFTATGPWEKEVNGIIKLEEDMATVTVWGQEWLDFSGVNEYKFYKTSDVPHLSESEY